MIKNFDINEQGFSIRCRLYYNKDIRNVSNIVIATYGFGGTKENKAVEKFADRIISKYKSYGVVCFDWPCHGMDARNKLIMEECVTYMNLVIAYVKQEMGAKRIYNYSSSFGAYITLCYLQKYGQNPFEKTAFRCAAIRMYDAMTRNVTEEEWNKLDKGKEILRGHERKIKITRDFLEDLRIHDVSNLDYMEYADDILMIHGTKDEAVPIEVAEEFSDNNVIELIKVQNADHPFSNPDYMDFAIQKMIEFFAPEE